MARAGLSPDRVVDLAVDVVDRDGPDALSLARVAEAAGVATPSLYKHVHSVADVRARVAARVVAQPLRSIASADRRREVAGRRRSVGSVAVSIAEVAAALRAVLADIAQLRARAAAGITAATNAHARLTSVAGLSRNPLVMRALGELAVGLDRLRQADQDAAAAAAAIVEYGRRIGVALPPPAPPVSTTSPAPAASPAPPPAVQATGRSLPVRAGRADQTTGVFNGERITSGKDLASVADLRAPPEGGWPDTLTRHVESHVAARMRRQRLTEGDVVLNNITCGNRGFDNDWPMCCDRLLPSVLPADTRLTVWATPDGGQTWWTKTYIGTGERIAP